MKRSESLTILNSSIKALRGDPLYQTHLIELVVLADYLIINSKWNHENAYEPSYKVQIIKAIEHICTLFS